MSCNRDQLERFGLFVIAIAICALSYLAIVTVLELSTAHRLHRYQQADADLPVTQVADRRNEIRPLDRR